MRSWTNSGQATSITYSEGSTPPPEGGTHPGTHPTMPTPTTSTPANSNENSRNENAQRNKNISELVNENAQRNERAGGTTQAAARSQHAPETIPPSKETAKKNRPPGGGGKWHEPHTAGEACLWSTCGDLLFFAL